MSISFNKRISKNKARAVRRNVIIGRTKIRVRKLKEYAAFQLKQYEVMEAYYSLQSGTDYVANNNLSILRKVIDKLKRL